LFSEEIEELDAANPDLDEFFRQKGFKKIGGIDEAGRGALAGPVVAACVVLDHENIPTGIADSKVLSDEKRREVYPLILECALSVGIGVADNKEIDRINILKATKLAMMRAFKDLKVDPDILLIDAIKLNEIPINSISIVRGESRSISIAAASIVAKVFRDNMMIKYSEIFPEYRFCENKGYGTSFHLKALMEYGPCEIHRHSYAPVIKALKKCGLKNRKKQIPLFQKSNHEGSV